MPFVLNQGHKNTEQPFKELGADRWSESNARSQRTVSYAENLLMLLVIYVTRPFEKHFGSTLYNNIHTFHSILADMQIHTDS